MSVALTDHLKIADEVLSTRVDQETVLLNLKTGMYHGLDPMGTRVFETLKASEDLTAVHAKLLSALDVEPERLETDLLAICDDMLARGILVPAKP